MLVTLDEIKTELGIVGNEYDSFITELILILSETIETFCARKLLASNYIQTIERGDFEGCAVSLYHYPVSNVTRIEIDGVEYTGTYRLHKPTGDLRIDVLPPFTTLSVEYSGGYAELPRPIRFAITSVIQEKYNRKTNGIDLSFGSDVQRISIPSVISVDFDYSLSNNESNNAFGMVLGNYSNLVRPYRADRSMMGSAMVAYVE